MSAVGSSVEKTLVNPRSSPASLGNDLSNLRSLARKARLRALGVGDSGEGDSSGAKT